MPDRSPATALTFVALLFLAVAAHGADAPCVLDGIGSFAPTDEGLDVVMTQRADLQVGDRLLQLNGRRLSTCADLEGALQDAQRQGMLAVVALRRGTAMQTVLLTVPRAVVAAPTLAPTQPSAPFTPTMQPLRSNPAALAPMVATVKAFGDAIELPLTGLQPYTRDFESLRGAFREQRARDAALAPLDPIVGYYETVAAMLAHRERSGAERVARDGASGPGEVARVRLPASVIEYSSDSDVAEWFRRYPFLEESIARAPRKVGWVEYNGLWRPDDAIGLLVARARAETAALSR